MDVPICVVGKVFKPNEQKVLALNRCLSEFMRAVKFYVHLKDTSRQHNKLTYEESKARFRLPTALIQNARDKAGEILKSFEENRKKDSVLVLKRISIRFDSRCHSFSKTTNILTPYWLNLKLNHGRRISLSIIFGKRQRQLIEDAFRGKLQFATVEMVKRKGKR